MINESEVKYVCDKLRDILIEEGNVEEVSSPITVLLLVNIDCIDLW